MLRVPDRAHWLYRLYDADDVLLYIGVTCNWEARWTALSKRPNLGPLVARKRFEGYMDRHAALDAEGAAIRAEYPLLNVKHNTGAPVTPDKWTPRKPLDPFHKRPTLTFTKGPSMPETEKNFYNLEEIAELMQMSTRWVRNEIASKDIEYSRLGNRIRMTAEQIEKFKALYTVNSIPQSITTGRKKRSA